MSADYHDRSKRCPTTLSTLAVLNHPRQMQPLNEGETTAAMLANVLLHGTVGGQPFEEHLKQTEVVLEVVERRDSPRA